MLHNPSDFIKDNPPDRIIGIETEYLATGIDNYAVTNAPNKDVEFHKLLNLVLMELGLEQENYSMSHFLNNGGKVYRDVGHLEYATPECAGPWEAAAADHAGMNIVNSITDLYTEKMGYTSYVPNLRQSGAVLLSRDSHEENDRVRGINKRLTKGYHENFLIPYNNYDQRTGILTKVLLSHLVTRSVWNGNGMVDLDGYVLSQKAVGINSEVTTAQCNRTQEGQKSAAIFLTDGSKVPQGWGLVEIRFADAHMSPRLTFISLAITSVVMRLVEYGIINLSNVAELTVVDPNFIKRLANNTYWVGKTKFPLQNGNLETGLSLQRKLADKASELAEEVKLPWDEALAIKEWHMFLDSSEKLQDVETDYSDLVGKTEWATKLYYLIARMQKSGNTMPINALNVEAHAFNTQWHVTGDSSIGKKVWAKLDPMLPDFLPVIQTLEAEPPHTRAKARVEYMKNHPDKVADWGVCRQKNTQDTAQHFYLKDPYQSEI